MVHSYLRLAGTPPDKPRICAVSYLNTAPLVWGLLHGPQRGAADLDFAIPSECARRVVAGMADAGIVPVVEMARHGLTPFSGLCIACRGEVRSILLFARRPWAEVETLAADTGSRTSVELARIVLQERFGIRPKIHAAEPHLARMLEEADAALLIGDAALAVDVFHRPGMAGPRAGVVRSDGLADGLRCLGRTPPPRAEWACRHPGRLVFLRRGEPGRYH